MQQLFRLLAAVVVLSFSTRAQACDICGCSGGNSSLGLLPLVQRHFIGMRWQKQGFESTPHGSGQRSTETFSTFDLWGRWQPHRRVQLIAAAPFTFNNRQYEDGSTLHSQGLGDVTLLAQFALLDPKKQLVRRWSHTFQVGGGTQLPTGNTNNTDAEGELLHSNIQPGAGVVAPLFSALYALRYRTWGVSADATARIGIENEAGYEFGNRMSTNLRFFKTITAGKFTLLPHVGALADLRKKDRDQGSLLAESGGYSVFGTAGMDVFRGNFILGLNWQQPVVHDVAKGYITPQARINATATLLIGKQKKTIDMQKTS